MEREQLIERKIGERLRRRRLELGLTQEQVGQVIGVSYQQIQKFERGANWVSAARLMLIAEYLRTDIDWLCGLSDVHPPSIGRSSRQPWDRTPEPTAPVEREALDLARQVTKIDQADVRIALKGLVQAVTERRGSTRRI